MTARDDHDDESRAQHALAWPMARLGEALELLATRSGLGHGADAPLGAPPAPAAGERELRRWVEWAAARLGVEAVGIDATVPELPEMLQGAAPALMPFDAGGEQRFFVLLGSRRGHLRVLGPDLREVHCPIDAVADAMCGHHARALQPELQALLALADVPAAQQRQVRSALLRVRLATERTATCWMVRQPPTAGFLQQLAAARVPHLLLAVLAVFTVVYALEIAGWSVIGRAVLDGRFDAGWLAAWALVLLSLVPLRLWGARLQGRFALDAGRILKSRLLAGALRMDLQRVRQQGVGQLLGRVLESQALESLALSGGLSVLVAVIELAFAAWVLGQGAAAGLQLAALGAWLGVTAALASRQAHRLRAWTATRLALTHDLVERMVGHRTRLAQERPERRETREDQALHGYLADAARMDRAAPPLLIGVPAGWMLLAIAALTPALAGAAATPTQVAISLGGVLLAQRAFGGIAGGLAGLARAAIAWQQVRELFEAGRPADAAATPATFVPGAPRAVQASGSATVAPLVEATGLAFRHRPDGAPVLSNLDLRIAHGDRILLEGPSGAGKSTLASLLTGLRSPQAGLLLLAGWDRPTLGDDWHRLATSAPQFHENHLVSATLAFNLLMGRDWPPSLEDLAEAEALCRELGLGDLLDRMPSGLQQRVGETGWQLSHGERSRIFLARALLQRAPLTVMDESFAALDPETLAQCLGVSMKRSDALVVIAHP